MAVVKFTSLGGIMPSMQPRELPPGGAQIAENLDLRRGDFRPLVGPGSSLTTVASAAKSVFRVPSGTWFSSAVEVDYVLAPLIDSGTERVIITGRQAYPELWQGGTYRQLGVPAPTTAPTTTVNVVDEFSTEEAEQFRTQALADYEAAILGAVSASTAGYSNAIATLPRGAYWLPHGTVAGMPSTDARMGCYCLPTVVSGSSFKMLYEEDNFALDPAFGAKEIVYLTNNFLAIPFFVKAQTYAFNETTFADAAALMLHPVTGLQLFPTESITTAGGRYAALVDPAVEPQKSMIDDINQWVSTVASIINPATGAILAESIEAFYAKTEIVDAIDAAIANFAESVWLAAQAAFNAPASAADTYYGAGYDLPAESPGL